MTKTPPSDHAGRGFFIKQTVTKTVTKINKQLKINTKTYPRPGYT